MQHYPSGGIGVGGSGGYRISGSYVTANVFSLLGDITHITNWNSVAGITGQPFSNVIDYMHPYKTWKKGATSYTQIILGFEKAIDMLALINVNFNDYNVIVIASQAFTTVRDPNTGLYNGVVRYSVPVTNITIEIPSQTPNDGSASFYAGAIVGGRRKDLSVYPLRPYQKRLVENILTREFEAGNREEEVAAVSYHELEYNFDIYEDTHLNDIAEVVGAMGEKGACVVYEKTSDGESIYLAQLIGNYDYSRESYGRRQARLIFNEIA